jgi:hypothetical protein
VFTIVDYSHSLEHDECRELSYKSYSECVTLTNPLSTIVKPKIYAGVNSLPHTEFIHDARE